MFHRHDTIAVRDDDDDHGHGHGHGHAHGRHHHGLHRHKQGSLLRRFTPAGIVALLLTVGTLVLLVSHVGTGVATSSTGPGVSVDNPLAGDRGKDAYRPWWYPGGPKKAVATSAQPTAAAPSSEAVKPNPAETADKASSAPSVATTTPAEVKGPVAPPPVPENPDKVDPAELAKNGWVKKVLVKGDGTSFPKIGQRIQVHYVGRLYDPAKPFAELKEFDSSRAPDRQPFDTSIGVGNLILGWDQAVPTMSLGEKALITISGEKAYGARGYPPTIPPDATLVFEIELLKLY